MSTQLRSSDPHAGWTLDEWVKGLHQVYGLANLAKDPKEVWLEALDEATKLYEEVRRGELSSQIVSRTVKMFAWVCSFVGKYTDSSIQTQLSANDPLRGLLVGGTYSRWIMTKYPGVCAFC